MRVLAIIPARYASTRFPGKPLAELGGKSIIERVYRAVNSVIEEVVVATDDCRIANAVELFGGKAMMTSDRHRCGTERCAEVAERVGSEYDIILNIQGDEPFICKEQIEALVSQFKNKDIDIATLAMPYTQEATYGDISNTNEVKVTIAKSGRALYFSRAVIPHLRDIDPNDWTKHHTFFRHIGVYGFRRGVLKHICQLDSSPLESGEKLEQLRWLEHGYSIGVGITTKASIGIDTPEDLERAEIYLATLTKGSQW